MTARSFSMAVILPLTTLPSKAVSSPRLSFSRASKSAREGFMDSVPAVVLIYAPSCAARARLISFCLQLTF